MEDNRDPDLTDAQKVFSTFMSEIKRTIEKLVGEDGMVACWGDPDNGIFCMSVSINTLPAPLVMASCVNMMAAHLHHMMADAYIGNQGQKIMGEVPKKVM